jgi:hypothetical protein
VWKENALPMADFSISSLLNFELDGFYLITSLPGRVLIYCINDGEFVAAVQVRARAYKAWMTKRQLDVLALEPHGQALAEDAAPYDRAKTLALPDAVGSCDEAYALGMSATALPYVYFTDFYGAIQRLNTLSGAVETLLRPRNNTSVEYIAVHEDCLIYSLCVGHSRGEDLYELHRLNPDTGYDGTIARNIALALPKVSLHGNSVYVCERQQGEVYFVHYPTAGGYVMAPAVDKWRISRASEIFDFYGVVSDGGHTIGFVYLSRGDRSNFIEACYIAGHTAERLNTREADALCTLVNVYNHVILADRRRGLMFDVKTLRAGGMPDERS